MKKHSDLPASGADRWMNCAASVRLSRGLPEPPASHYAEEGTTAHGFLEDWLHEYKTTGTHLQKSDFPSSDMYEAVKKAVHFILKIWDEENEELFIEQRYALTPINPIMFGTADITLVNYKKRTLKVYDYKHGSGQLVDIVKEVHGEESLNLQLAYYGLGAIYKFGVNNFSSVTLGIIQPRTKDKNGQTIRSATVTTGDIMRFEHFFRKGAKRALSVNSKPFMGSWCHWCKAKSVCPLQNEKNHNKFVDDFGEL